MKVYTSSNCPNCNAIKQLLLKKKIVFEEVDGTTNKTIAFLRARKLPMQLPIIEQDNKFFTFEQCKEMI